MDINLNHTQKKQHAPIAASKTKVLALKLNQQIEVKVISTQKESLSLILQTTQSHKSLQVQSNLPIETKPGQTLQLIVSKLTPTVEFKVLNSGTEIKLPDHLNTQDSVKPLDLKEIVLKQIIQTTKIQKSPVQTKALATLPPPSITAKILAINGDKIQLKLYTNQDTVPTEYTKSLQQNILQKNNPIITITREQLSPSAVQANSSKQVIIDLQEYKPGQKIQLEIKKQGTNPEFKIIDQPVLKLAQGQVLPAKVIAIKNSTLQLLIPDKTGDKMAEITLNEKQLSYTIEKSDLKTAVAPLSHLKNFKIGQNIRLEVTKQGSQPEFKVLDIKSEKLSAGQVITAKVVDIKNNKIQLQLTGNNLTQAVNTLNNPKKPQPAVISLNKNQITTSETALKKSLDAPLLIKGQQVKLEVIKTGIQTEFKLIQNPLSNPQQKIADTFKQLLPMQEPPSVLLNQIIKNLETINTDEKIPDTLKRLAQEILDSLPQTKNLNNPRHLRQLISHSGLFMEAKIAQYANNNAINLPADFKTLLLKFQQTLKQELDTKLQQQDQKIDINLIKEMQQKTENSLAKIILNQLASLPKEDGPRQVWILDLPFLNKNIAESVKIEIDRDQYTNNERKEENWNVTITVTPPELGTIHCKITCFDKTVNTRFWSDKPETVTKISTRLGYLKTQFEQAGINTGLMSAQPGIPTTDMRQQMTDQSLFNQKV